MLKNNFKNKLKKEVTTIYSELLGYLNRYPLINVLVQYNLIYLMSPKTEPFFVEDFSDAHRNLEFLFGLIMSGEIEGGEEVNPDVAIIHDLLNQYFYKLSISEFGEKEDDRMSSLKSYSTFVRGKTYPQTYFELAKSYYAPHKDWFLKNLGFTIEDCESLFYAIRKEILKRVKDKSRIKQESKTRVNKGHKDVIQGTKEFEELLEVYSVFITFCEGDEFFLFSPEEISETSKIPISRVQSLMKRLSQRQGYKNPNMDTSYKEPFDAISTYNTIIERPIIEISDNKYLFVTMATLPEVCFETFHYDLIGDENYENTYTESRGNWLENYTVYVLQRIFSTDEIYRNVLFIDPTGVEYELCDVLVLTEEYALIIQCKSKELTENARKGKNSQEFLDGWEKGILENTNQLFNAKHIVSQNNTFFEKGSSRKITFNKKIQFEYIGVYREIFANLLINLKSSLGLEDELQKFGFYSVSIFDLDIITKIIDSKYIFKNYIKKRLEIENEKKKIISTEIDLLGLYLDAGSLWHERENADCVAYMDGAETIDQYLDLLNYESQQNPKPQLNIPPIFRQLISDIEKIRVVTKQELIDYLLFIKPDGKEEISKQIEKALNKSLQNGTFCNIALSFGSWGITFISSSEKNIKSLKQSVEARCNIDKETYRANLWFCIGTRSSSGKIAEYIHLERKLFI